ncbi:MAG: T9SS type A sorting domain-containing protein [Bacteroidia bacterium]
MKKLLLIVLTLTIFEAKAQTNVYYPFPDSNTVWSVNASKYFIKGDTVYNSLLYKKFFGTNDTTLSSSLQYCGMIRQDVANKKVFGVPAYQTTEGTIYDFNLNINDTATLTKIDGNCYGFKTSFKVLGKDSILIDGNYRQTLIVQNIYTTYPDTLIQGIGSYAGPFSPGENYQCGADFCQPILLCMKKNGILVYQNPYKNTCYIDCSGIGIEQINIKHQISIYPNPASTVLQITYSNERLIEVSVVDVLGKEVLQSKQTTLDVSNLNSGVYFMHVKTNAGNYTIKFIKQ